jgi:hypothetical protein
MKDTNMAVVLKKCLAFGLMAVTTEPMELVATFGRERETIGPIHRYTLQGLKFSQQQL